MQQGLMREARANQLKLSTKVDKLQKSIDKLSANGLRVVELEKEKEELMKEKEKEKEELRMEIKRQKVTPPPPPL
jgi:hypothetical protein